MRSVLLIFFVLIPNLAVLARSNSEMSEKNSETGFRIVASNSIIADVTKELLGNVDSSTLDVITPRGVDNHTFVPKPSHTRIMAQADLIIINGLGLENTAVQSIIQSIINESSTTVLDLSRGISPLLLADHANEKSHTDEEDNHGKYDPHHWFSPLNVIKWTQNIAEYLAEKDKSNAEIYITNAEIYIQKLRAVHKKIQESISAINPEKRNVIVDHQSIAYFAEEYGLNVSGSILESASSQSESSARHLVDLQNLMAEKYISVIIIGKTAGKTIENLAHILVEGNVGAKNVKVVRILIESLAEKGKRGSTYIDFMNYNTELIIQALSRT